MIIFIAGWVVCGVLTYAMAFADAQAGWEEYEGLRKEHYRSDMGSSMAMGLFGYIGLICIFLLTGFAKHGLKFK